MKVVIHITHISASQEEEHFYAKNHFSEHLYHEYAF